MARLGPSGLAQLFREIANYVSKRLSDYNTKDELDSLLDTKADDNNVIHTSGNETIKDIKKFTSDIMRKYIAVDITTTPTSDMYAHVNFTDKNEKIVAYIQYAQKTNGVDYIGLRVRDKNSTTWGVQLNTNKEFVPLDNKSYSLGSASYKWSKVYSDDIVHTSGDEYIHGTKIFSGVIHRYADLTTSGGEQVYRFDDINTNACGHIYNNVHWVGDAIYNRHGAYNQKSGKTAEIDITSNDSGFGIAYVAGTATKGNLETVTSATGHTGIATMGWVNNPATSTNVVHRTGNETISGTKYFNNDIYTYSNMFIKNNSIDLTVTPSTTNFNQYLFRDKNDVTIAYVQLAQQSDGNVLGSYVKDKSGNLYGVRVNTLKHFTPYGDNTYSLGTSGMRWANVYATRINCDNIIRAVENSYIYMTAGPAWNNGASIFLNGKSGDGLGTGKGTFIIYARDGTDEKRLLGYPNGILSWNGCIETHEVRSTTANSFMAQNGSYTFVIRNDGSNTYFLMSEKDGTPGTWSTARPLTIANATGVCSINGNANSATYATTQAVSDNSTKIATTAYVKSQGHVSLTSLAGGNSAGSLSHSVGSLILARCSSTALANTKSYANVAGQQLYPCRTEIYTAYNSTGYQFIPIVVRYSSDGSIGSGTWRYLGGSNVSVNNAAGDIFGMFLRVA